MTWLIELKGQHLKLGLNSPQKVMHLQCVGSSRYVQEYNEKHAACTVPDAYSCMHVVESCLSSSACEYAWPVDSSVHSSKCGISFITHLDAFHKCHP